MARLMRILIVEGAFLIITIGVNYAMPLFHKDPIPTEDMFEQDDQEYQAVFNPVGLIRQERDSDNDANATVLPKSTKTTKRRRVSIPLFTSTGPPEYAWLPYAIGGAIAVLCVLIITFIYCCVKRRRRRAGRYADTQSPSQRKSGYEDSTASRESPWPSVTRGLWAIATIMDPSARKSTVPLPTKRSKHLVIKEIQEKTELSIPVGGKSVKTESKKGEASSADTKEKSTREAEEQSAKKTEEKSAKKAEEKSAKKAEEKSTKTVEKKTAKKAEESTSKYIKPLEGASHLHHQDSFTVSMTHGNHHH